MSRLIKRLSLLLQMILVVIFIVFEEIIWEGIAIPIYRYLHSLKLLHSLEEIIESRANRYILLVIFLAIFVVVEVAGVVAGVLIVTGYPIVGFLIYLTKIPIAGFTFWLFKISKDKLISFRWFEFVYIKLIAFIDWIKSLTAYQNIVKLWYRLKGYIRYILASDRKQPRFIKGFRRLYRLIKK